MTLSRMTHISAHLHYLRMSPRKVRLVADTMRGRGVQDATTVLSLMPKAAAVPLKKLLHSAVANARHSFGVTQEQLMIDSVKVDPGPMLKRWTPKAFGRAAPVKRRSCHVGLVLRRSDGAPLAVRHDTTTLPPVSLAEVHEAKQRTGALPQESRRASPQHPSKGERRGFFRKMFSRKAI
jgi:large subunit ribosomal protein L22